MLRKDPLVLKIRRARKKKRVSRMNELIIHLNQMVIINIVMFCRRNGNGLVTYVSRPLSKVEWYVPL